VHQQKLFPTAAPLPGVEKLLKDLHATTKTAHPIYIALATSSHRKNFELKTGHLKELFSVFPKANEVVGDDPRIGKGRGKPLPDIYLLALETINEELSTKGEQPIKPEECLVFEDAVPGVEAGRRAGMQVLWCPHPGLLTEYKGREEEVLAGLTGEHKEEEKTGAEKEAEALQGERISRGNGSGKPGKLNDGWGRLLPTLENFPYEKYGIEVP
jgi:pseudouridine 5'-phosphatase